MHSFLSESLTALAIVAVAGNAIQAVIAERCLYSVLGVKPDASQQKLDKAFHKLALKYHSDDIQFRNANPIFEEITRAYHILSNPIQRKQYDKDPSSFALQRTIGDEDSSDFDESEDDQEDVVAGDAKTHQKVTMVKSGSFSYSHTTQKDGEDPVTHSVSGGFHTGQDCKTVTEKIGNKISTHTSCTSAA